MLYLNNGSDLVYVMVSFYSEVSSFWHSPLAKLTFQNHPTSLTLSYSILMLCRRFNIPYGSSSRLFWDKQYFDEQFKQILSLYSMECILTSWESPLLTSDYFIIQYKSLLIMFVRLSSG